MKLPTSTAFQKVQQAPDGNVVCEFLSLRDTMGHDLPGSFVLTLDQPMILLESAANEIKDITGSIGCIECLVPIKNNNKKR